MATDPKKDQPLVPKVEDLRRGLEDNAKGLQDFRDIVERPTFTHTASASSNVTGTVAATLVGDTVSVNVPPGCELKISVNFTLSVTSGVAGAGRTCTVELCDVTDTTTTLRSVAHTTYYTSAALAHQIPMQLTATVGKRRKSVASFRFRLTNQTTAMTTSLAGSQYWEIEFKPAKMRG